MKHFEAIILLAGALLIGQVADAQQVQVETKKYSNFSIELSTGHPSILAMLGSKGGTTKDWTWTGYKKLNPVTVQLNFSARYSLNRRWEFLLMGSFAPHFYTIERLPYQDPETKIWSGEPYLDGIGSRLASGAVTAFTRVNYGFFEHCHFYSALGIGVDFTYKQPALVPFPYVTPVGIMVGETHRVYGTAEITVGTGGTFLLFGLGVRI